ncbi:MAG: hypothetical protein K5669_04175 [Lachnospiraceae bacterium]|nr:hypothetical protein [Lachnospiraceae bacterium]
MKWKQNVSFEEGDKLIAVINNNKIPIPESDRYIAELMLAGISEDDMLLDIVSKKLEGDELKAGLRLAQFVEDYSLLLEEGEKSSVFET